MSGLPEELRPDEADALSDEEYAAGRARRRRRLGMIAVVVIVALLASAVAFSIGRLSTIGTTTPPTISAEAGFARDMQVHHDQGAELSMMIRDRTDDEAVRSLAYDITITQTKQSGMMAGWLAVWGLPQMAPEPEMTWMTRPGLDGTGHDHGGKAEAAHVPGEPMPGLATPAEIDRLAGETGVTAVRDFLNLMIAHHKGAIEMADAVIDRSENPTVLNFARGVSASQQAEIDLMNSMLAERE